MQNLKPKKGDRAQFRFNAPAIRYMDRWGEVVRANRKQGTVILAFPTQRKGHMTVKMDDLFYQRNGKTFTSN